MAAAENVELRGMEALAVLLEGTARGAAQGGASRQVAAAMIAATMRTSLDCSAWRYASKEVQGRTQMVGLSLELHQLLDRWNGVHSNSVGGALSAARSKDLSREQYKECRRLQRHGNAARHDPFEPAGDVEASGSSAEIGEASMQAEKLHGEELAESPEELAETVELHGVELAAVSKSRRLERQMVREPGAGKTESPDELAGTAELPGVELAADNKSEGLVRRMVRQLEAGKTESPEEPAGAEELPGEELAAEGPRTPEAGKTESPGELAETAELPGAELAADDKPGSLVVQMAGQHEAGKTGSPEEPAGAE